MIATMKLRSLLLLVSVTVLICWKPAHGEQKKFVEPDYGFSLSFETAQWIPAPLAVRTLGEPCLVLVDAPQPTRLFVAFVRSAPGDAAEDGPQRIASIAERLGRIANQLEGVEVVLNDTVEVDGKQAVSYRYAGKGTGIGIGGGEVQTTQHWIAVPRDRDLIVFQLTANSDGFDDAYAEFQKIVETAEIDDRRPTEKADRRFVSEELSISVDYPGEPWIRGGYELGDFFVPGYLLRLWSAPSETGRTADGTTSYATRLAFFMQFPGREYRPQELIDVSIPGLTQNLGAKVVEQKVLEIAGRDAMWLLVEGKSATGSTLGSQGDIDTRQLWVAVPRNKGPATSIAVFLLNTPAADYDQRVEELQTLLESLKLELD